MALALAIMAIVWLFILTLVYLFSDHTEYIYVDKSISLERLKRWHEEKIKQYQRTLNAVYRKLDAIERGWEGKERADMLKLYNADGNARWVSLRTIVKHIMEIDGITVPQTDVKSVESNYSINKPKQEES